jgi:hypothetical protein
MATFGVRFWEQYNRVTEEPWSNWFIRLVVDELDRKGRAGSDTEATVLVGSMAGRISEITSLEWHTALGIDEHTGSLLVEYGFITNADDLVTPEIFYLVVTPKLDLWSHFVF